MTESQPSQTASPKAHSPWMGVMLSLLMPGAGQFVSGRRALGIKWFIALSASNFFVVWLCASSWIPGLLPGLLGVVVLLAAWVAMLRNSYRLIPRLKISAWLILLLVVALLSMLGEAAIPPWALPLFQAFKVPTDSMMPTIQTGDRVLVDKCAYWFAKPKPGDIVAVQMGGYPRQLPQSTIYLRRVVAIPGDKVEVNGRILQRNEQPVKENYTQFNDPGSIYEHYGPQEVPQAHYYIMGDNRDNSQDSRWWGPVPEERILGKLSKIYWPLYRAGRVY